MKLRLPIFFIIVYSAGIRISPCETFHAANTSEVRTYLTQLKPGDILELQPGTYQGGIVASNLSGAPEKMITIRGSDSENRPIITGGKTGMHLRDCSYLRISNLVLKSFPVNAINIDDGGSADSPAQHIVVENVDIINTGPKGNKDSLKMSGVDHFQVRNCRFAGWGGQGIDMVGCHDGVIEGCHFEGKTGFSQTTAVQCKGGSRDVKIHKSVFRDVGHRGINLGGSTGLPHFRPQNTDYEAKNIEVAGNIFIGGVTPVAYASSTDCHVHHNTIIHPEKWVARILQEQRDPRFKPCRKGSFTRNLIVFDQRITVFVNVGNSTDPESFVFEGNAWFDSQGDREPRLPVNENRGIYGVDPKLKIEGNKAIPTSNQSSLLEVGAHAYSDKSRP